MKGYRGIISKGKFPDAQRRSRRSATLPADAPTTPTRRPADPPRRRHVLLVLPGKQIIGKAMQDTCFLPE
jgi:hypothetical protein